MILDLLRAEGFREGAFLGALAALLILVAHRRGPVLSLAGGVVVATLVGLQVTTSLPGSLVAAIAVLTLAAFVAQRAQASPVLQLLALAPGGVLVAVAADITGPGWLGPFVACAAVAIAVGMGDVLAGPSEPGFAPAMIVVAALGVYATVPETGAITVIVGALLPAALLGLRRTPPFLSRVTASALAGLLVWIAAVGGQPRSSSVIGATVCFGVVVVDSLVLRGFEAWGRAAVARRVCLRLIGLLAIHVVVVAIGSRVVGLRPSASEAAVLATVTLIGAAIAVGIIELGAHTHGPHAR